MIVDGPPRKRSIVARWGNGFSNSMWFGGTLLGFGNLGYARISKKGCTAELGGNSGYGNYYSTPKQTQREQLLWYLLRTYLYTAGKAQKQSPIKGHVRIAALLDPPLE